MTVQRSEQDAYHELSAYTLGHGGPSFIHQHVVDAFAAQRADERTKPIGLTFALVGLYLHLEKGFSGRHVQRVHMQMGSHKRQWPQVVLPAQRGSVTAVEVMAAPEGAERDKAIDDWCRSVWEAFAPNRGAVIDLLRHYGID
jgi:hypothetical protein